MSSAVVLLDWANHSSEKPNSPPTSSRADPDRMVAVLDRAACPVVGRSSAMTTAVVHVTQGSYAGSISWFQNPSAPAVREGYVDDPVWFTDALYRSSAALSRCLTDKYGRPSPPGART